MDIRKELKATITVITEDRVAVEITLLNEVSLGVLYYERPKQGWVNKPIMPTRWRCIDANVEGVYQWGGEKILISTIAINKMVVKSGEEC